MSEENKENVEQPEAKAQQEKVNNESPITNTTNIYQIESKSNGMGIAGFVIAILALPVGWIPILGWLVWVLGLIFSIVGVTRKPKGLAIAGLIISLIGLIFLISLGALGLAASTMD